MQFMPMQFSWHCRHGCECTESKTCLAFCKMFGLIKSSVSPWFHGLPHWNDGCNCCLNKTETCPFCDSHTMSTWERVNIHMFAEGSGSKDTPRMWKRRHPFWTIPSLSNEPILFTMDQSQALHMHFTQLKRPCFGLVPGCITNCPDIFWLFWAIQ